jgi:hypothetical protein
MIKEFAGNYETIQVTIVLIGWQAILHFSVNGYRLDDHQRAANPRLSLNWNALYRFNSLDLAQSRR